MTDVDRDAVVSSGDAAIPGQSASSSFESTPSPTQPMELVAGVVEIPMLARNEPTLGDMLLRILDRPKDTRIIAIPEEFLLEGYVDVVPDHIARKYLMWIGCLPPETK